MFRAIRCGRCAAPFFRRIAAVLVAGCLFDVPAVAAVGPTVDFNREIRPLLSRNCFACHGPDEKHRSAGLRLDSHAGATAKLDSGERAIVPGKIAESQLIARITSSDASLRMPPADSGITLKPEEIDRLRRWVEQGAAYAEHWAFIKPVRPEIPAVSQRDWPQNGIDYFILARLEAAGLQPSPLADRYALIRRLSLDLRGLPPTPGEVDRFVNDSASDAYDRLVDRFLADAAYGERWARMWLDLARYADSKGYGSDPLREIWKYRDWVIDAFNRNLPYDRFTIEQLAGDLLPDATREQQIATAFHRNTMTNTEGGTDDEEFRVAAVKDRIETTLQVWMGLTLGCANCHNHKYDPILQQDYYAFYAFFNQTADADRPDETPTLAIPTPELEAARSALDGQIAPLQQQLKSVQAEIEQLKSEIPADPARATEETPVIAPTPASLAAVAKQAELDKAAARLQNEIKSLEQKKPAIPTVPVMQELPPAQRRRTFIMAKGNFLSPGAEVSPALPSAFRPPQDAAEASRLSVAQWLVSGENPLTARVAVNRFWAQLFGTGLVETQEDFGTQGELPSHPELLDWLAIEFVQDGWDAKQLLRRIVTSATYRQSAEVTPDRLQRDPQNRLLSRGARFRLEAEMVRDQALALSGLLSRKQHGPSVFPPQPAGLWRAAFNGKDRNWATSEGEDRYRRGLYTFWRRTIPYPSMATFDAPSREVCSPRRIRTNTPLQALVTLNDPVYVEAAQALARRIVREGGSKSQERIRFALELCLVRPASDEQASVLERLYLSERDYYREHPEEARQLATDPLGPLPEGLPGDELAAWTVVANVLLNLDAVLMK